MVLDSLGRFQKRFIRTPQDLPPNTTTDGPYDGDDCCSSSGPRGVAHEVGRLLAEGAKGDDAAISDAWKSLQKRWWNQINFHGHLAAFKLELSGHDVSFFLFLGLNILNID